MSHNIPLSEAKRVFNSSSGASNSLLGGGWSVIRCARIRVENSLRIVVAAFVFSTLSAHAHHGLDFMLLQDGTIPKPGSGMFFNNAQWSTFNGDDEFGTEPGIHLGVTPWLAIGTTASIMDEGNGWHYLSTTPYFNMPIFNSDLVPWLHISVYAGYELPDNIAHATKTQSLRKTKSSSKTQRSDKVAPRAEANPAADSAASASSRNKFPSKSSVARGARVTRHTTGGNVGGGGPDAPTGGTGHDHPVTTSAAPPPAQQKSTTNAPEPVPEPVILFPVDDDYQGIHRHGEEGLHARLIIDVELGDRDKIIGNVISFTPRQGTSVWGYAFGYRHAFHHDLAASLEAIGDFDGRGSHEALIAAHYTVSHALTLKLGVSMGLTENSPDASVHAGVVWRF